MLCIIIAAQYITCKRYHGDPNAYLCVSVTTHHCHQKGEITVIMPSMDQIRMQPFFFLLNSNFTKFFFFLLNYQAVIIPSIAECVVNIDQESACFQEEKSYSSETVIHTIGSLILTIL